MTKAIKSKGPEFLVDLTVNAEHVLRECLGLDEEQAELAAKEIRDRMRREWGGQLVYFGKGKSIDIAERDLAMWNDFTGRNHQHLADKYDMALPVVYRRIRIIRDMLRKESEPDLFD